MPCPPPIAVERRVRDLTLGGRTKRAHRVSAPERAWPEDIPLPRQPPHGGGWAPPGEPGLEAALCRRKPVRALPCRAELQPHARRPSMRPAQGPAGPGTSPRVLPPCHPHPPAPHCDAAPPTHPLNSLSSLYLATLLRGSEQSAHRRGSGSRWRETWVLLSGGGWDWGVGRMGTAPAKASLA